MKGKVLSINDSIVSVGISSDDFNPGKLEKFPIDSFNFVPKIGDEVEIFKSYDQIIISKVEKTMNLNTNLEREGYVNKWLYVLLIFLGGAFGLHKFYSGKIFQGVMYLLFSWTTIPAMIAFVELILAVIKTPDSNGNIRV